jgi:predicted peroxiredoxin
MKKLLATLLVACATALAGQAAAQDGKNLVTIVGTPEPQTQLMSMVLSMQALQQGASVYILLCGPGGDLALKDAPDSATAPQKPKGMSPQALMKKVMAQGGTVEVCAIYLPNKGVGQDALIEGVGSAKPPEMAARLLDDNARIMSF